MAPLTKTLSGILKLNFGICQSDISDSTNLIQEFNLCEWELELLYLKLEIAFNIEIKKKIPNDSLCLKELQREIKENMEEEKYEVLLQEKTFNLR
jgi:hypothetical protein